MPRTSSPDGLADLLEKQSSVVSRGQLLTLGMKDNTMQYRVRRGGITASGADPPWTSSMCWCRLADSA